MRLRLAIFFVLTASLAGSALGQTFELVPPPHESNEPYFEPDPSAEGCNLPAENILVIILDDVGTDNVGCYGEGACPPPTPNIDTLARTGVLFRNAWSNPTCSATRAGIHTGRYSFRTGVGWVATPITENEILPLSEITIPEVLSPCGYACGLIGKWHLGNRTTGGKSAPLMQGWDYHAGTMWHNLAPRRSYYRWPRTVNGHTEICRTYATVQTTTDAIQWIHRQNGPWFCYLAYNAAHKPFHAPPPELHSYNLQGLDPDDNPVPFYLAMVQAMDTEIGRLLCSISDQLEHTTVILIGDNGTPEEVVLPPCNPQHAKFSVYEGGIHIPMIISGAGVVDPGRESYGLVSTVDIFSTVLELAGHSPCEVACPSRPLDSVSMVPYMLNPELGSIRETMYSETFRRSDINDGNCAIRNYRYKLICNEGCGGTREFYDLWNDPYEACNLLRAGNMNAEQQENYAELLQECVGLRSGSIAYAQGLRPCILEETPVGEPVPASE